MTAPTHNPLEQAMTMSGKPSGFRSLVGYRAVVWTRDYAEIELQLGPQHTNSLGILHGGVLMTMMDAAMGHAATWCPVKGHVRICVTLGMTTNFIAQAKTGTVRVIARLIGIHDRVGTATCEATDGDGRLIAAAQASFRYAPGSEAYEGVAKAAGG
jgi:uncharacterized protein (TIGR00369 family)